MPTRSSTPAAFVVALGQKIDLAAYRAEIDNGDRPRHVLLELAERTGGRAVSTSGLKLTVTDRLMGKIVGRDTSWQIAWHVRADARRGFVYGNAEAIGFALLLVSLFRPSRARMIGFNVMTPRGARVRWWLRLIRLLHLAPVITVETERKAEVLRPMVGPACASRMVTLLTPVDTDFFTPGSAAPTHATLVASAGKEHRDYATLAAAVDGLDVDVEVCAVSPDAAGSSTAMPTIVPDRMSFVDLDMRSLRDLYRRATVVAVPTSENQLDAGFTSVLEAMACARPVIVTAQGAQEALSAANVVRSVPIADTAGLRNAVTSLVDDQVAAATMGERAREHVIRVHGTDRWLDDMSAHLRRCEVLGAGQVSSG